MAKASKTSRTKRQWIWILSAMALLLLNIGLAAILLLSHESRRMEALEVGQRVEFAPKAGKVHGTLHRLADLQAGTAPQTAEQQADDGQGPDYGEKTIENATVEPAPLPNGEETSHAQLDGTPENDTQTNAPDANKGLDPVQVRTTSGVVPRIAKDGKTPWKYYARPAPNVAENTPQIAIVLTGLGLGSLTTESALALPADVTLSFSPYSRESEKWIARAEGAGHEIMLDMPAETTRYPAMDPGPLGILNKTEAAKLYEKLLAIMEKASHYVGLTLPIDESISTNGTLMSTLVPDISKHGLILLGSGEASREFSNASRNATQPVLFADVVLDERITQAHITQQLNELEAIAKKQGFAIAIGRSFPVTVELVSEWARSAPERGMVLVPVTALAK